MDAATLNGEVSRSGGGTAVSYTDAAREFIAMNGRDAKWARTSARIALAALLVAALSIVGNVYQASLPRSMPYVLQEMPDGSIGASQRLAPAAEQRPDVPWVRYMLSRWISDTRSVTSDPRTQKEFQARAAALLAQGSPAESMVQAYYQAVNPYNGGDARVSVKLNSVRPAPDTDRRYELDWIEETIDRQGRVVTHAHWNAVASVDYSQQRVTVPGTADDPTYSNPYGMYITDLSWNKVAY